MNGEESTDGIHCQEPLNPMQSDSQSFWCDNGIYLSNVISVPIGETQIHYAQDIVDEQQSQRGKCFQKDNKKLDSNNSISTRGYQCSICDATFSNSSNLKSHSRIHTGERPYVCEVCGVAFVQSSNLKAHKRVHTGERPFKCSECDQSFTRSSHLAGHMRTHTGERPYICGVCHDSFVTSTHLRNHMRKHTGERPFICQVCETSFALSGSLQIHLRIHTGERPFSCGDCKTAFRSKADLRSHCRLHTDLRPFLCSLCSKSFKTKPYLQKHKKKCGSPPSGNKRGRPKKSNCDSESVSNLSRDDSASEPKTVVQISSIKNQSVQNPCDVIKDFNRSSLSCPEKDPITWEPTYEIIEYTDNNHSSLYN